MVSGGLGVAAPCCIALAWAASVALVAPGPRPSRLDRVWALSWKRVVPTRSGGVSLALSGLGMMAALCCGPVRVPRAVLEGAGSRSIPKQSSSAWHGQLSLAAGGSAPGPPTYFIPASLEKVAEDLAPLGPQPPFSRSSGDTETTQISYHTTHTVPYTGRRNGRNDRNDQNG